MSNQPAPFEMLAHKLATMFELASQHFQAVSVALSATNLSPSPLHQSLHDLPIQHHQLAYLPNRCGPPPIPHSRTTSASNPQANPPDQNPPSQESDIKPIIPTWPLDGSTKTRARAKLCPTSPSLSPMHLGSESSSANAADPLGRVTPATPATPLPAEPSPGCQKCSFIIDPSLQQSCDPLVDKMALDPHPLALSPDLGNLGPEPKTLSPDPKILVTDPRDTDERQGNGAQSLLARIGGSTGARPKAPGGFNGRKVPSISNSSRTLSSSSRMDMSESSAHHHGSRRLDSASLSPARGRDYAESTRCRDRPKCDERALSPQWRGPPDVSQPTSNRSHYHESHRPRHLSPPSAPRHHPYQHALTSKLALSSRMAKAGHRLDSRDRSGENPYLVPTRDSPPYTRLVQLLKNLQAPDYRAVTPASELLDTFDRFSRHAETLEEETMGEIYRSPELLESFLKLAFDRRIITLHINTLKFKRSTIKLDIRLRYV